MGKSIPQHYLDYNIEGSGVKKKNIKEKILNAIALG